MCRSVWKYNVALWKHSGFDDISVSFLIARNNKILDYPLTPKCGLLGLRVLSLETILSITNVKIFFFL